MDNPFDAMVQFFSFIGWIIFLVLMIVIARNTGKTARYTKRMSDQMFGRDSNEGGK